MELPGPAPRAPEGGLAAETLGFLNIHPKAGLSVVKFGDLEQLVFDRLWREKRVAIYATAWEMERELERLADLGVVRYVSGLVEIEDPGGFLKKTEPLVARSMISGDKYLKHVVQAIQNSAEEYAKNVLAPQRVPQL